MSNKIRVLIFTAILIFLSFIYYSYSNSEKKLITTPSSTPNQAEQMKVSLIVDYGNNNPKTYEYSFLGEKSAFDILKEVAEKEGIPIETQQYDFGTLITSINGFKSDEHAFWIYEVNGKPATIGANTYILKNGDIITWKYVAE